MTACTVVTPRLRLTPLAPHHVGETYVGWLNDPALMAFSQHGGRRHDAASCRAYARGFDHVRACLWAVEAWEDGPNSGARHIGNVNAHLTPHGVGDIGLLIGAGAGGQGYGLETWRAAMAALFVHHGLRKVTGGCLAPHGAMRRIMARAGMADDGVRRGQALHRGQPVDVVHCATFAEDFALPEGWAVAPAPLPAWDP